MSARPVRVAINAQVLPDGGKGGVETITVGLLSALGRLGDSPEEYVVVTHPDNPDWLAPHLGPNQRIVSMPDRGPYEQAKSMLGPLRAPISRALGRATKTAVVGSLAGTVHGRTSVQQRFFRGLGVDVLHFPSAPVVVTGIPTIFNPHDLQHRHFPEFFSPQAVRSRERSYQEGCRHATVVAAGSEWARQDFVEQFGLSPDKVQVIPWAAPLAAYKENGQTSTEAVAARFRLDTSFALYPAATWKHKNHLGLVEAVALLRDRHGLMVNVVCTGVKKGDHWPRIADLVTRLGLEDQVRFLGLIDPSDLRALFRAARFLVFPSLFEPASAPIFEAWEEGLPVTCSAVAGLPEQVGDAALQFDPRSTESIADAMRRMWLDEDCRAELRKKGEARRRAFTWERTARMYRALYRRLAGVEMSAEDVGLLEAPEDCRCSP